MLVKCTIYGTARLVPDVHFSQLHSFTITTQLFGRYNVIYNKITQSVESICLYRTKSETD